MVGEFSRELHKIWCKGQIFTFLPWGTTMFELSWFFHNIMFWKQDIFLYFSHDNNFFLKYQFFLENGYIEFFTSKLGYVSLQNPKNFQMFELPSDFQVKDFFTCTEQ